MSQEAHQAGAYPGFCSMKLPGVFLLSPWMGCQSITGLPTAFSLPVPVFYTWVVRGTVRVSCPRTQCNVPSQDLNPDFTIQSQAH